MIARQSRALPIFVFALVLLASASAQSPASPGLTTATCGQSVCTWDPFVQNYTRGTGSPAAVTSTFSIKNSNAPYKLRLYNGGIVDGEYELVGQTTVVVNGVSMVANNQFNQSVPYFEEPITLQAGQNTISVTLKGKVGGGITVEITGQDSDFPSIKAALSPTPNSAGWNNANVSVSFACDDATSGVATCPTAASLTNEGANQLVSGTVKDLAGNSATLTVAINLDKTKPQLTSTLTPAADPQGWNNSAVTVSYTCSDSLSGVVSCPSPATFSNEGTAQTSTATIQDVAGNVASLNTVLNIDKTAPSITAFSTPAANAAGWNNSSVTVAFTCADTLSGINICPVSQVVSTDGAKQSISGTATDNATNTQSATANVSLDQTPPSVTLSVTPQPNTYGWNNGNVSVTFNCTDATSGVATCPQPATVTTEGASQKISGTAVDVAGNSTSGSVNVSIDKTPPTMTYTAAPSPNSNGWNNSDVTLTYQCADALSGIATCPNPQIVASEGGSQPTTATASDKAGNNASVTASVSLDKTAPSITASISPQPNAAGWNNTNATVQFICADSLSGVANCTPATTLSTEGTAQALNGQATDLAGNTASATATVSIDKTPPTITASVSPAPNANGWNSSTVTVTFSCSDSGSGIATCPAPIAVATEGASQLISGVAVDNAGNQSTSSVTLNISKTPPTVSVAVAPAANSFGWNNSAMVATFTCNATVAPVATCPTPQTVSAEGANQQVTGAVVDLAGNTATATANVNIDLTAPAINSSATPSPNLYGWNNTDVTVSFVCSDALSGINICPPVQTVSLEGSQTLTAAAVDKAGNIKSTTSTVNLDKTPPTVAVTVAPPPNPAGWNNSDVTVSFTCSDALSGVLSCPSPTKMSTEGRALSVTGSASDKAGNTATGGTSVNLDKTPPTITSSVSPQPNAAGWLNTNATISFQCSDVGSGIANCPQPISVTSEGAGQSFVGTATDVAGNTATSSIAVNIAKTPPQISTAVSVPANANGWNNSAITVSFTCSPTVAPIATCPLPVTVSTEGANQVVKGTATDAAGNSASISVTLNIDLSAPTITSSVPAPNASGWYLADVPVAFTCTDALSGVAQCSPSLVVSTEGANQVITGQAADKAGNTATTSVKISLEKSPVTVSASAAPAANTSGWNNSNVTVSFTCNSTVSGSVVCPAAQTVSSEGAAQKISETATDAAGTSASASLTINIDKTAPTVNSVVNPLPNSAGWNNSAVTVSYQCADALSGVASCPAAVTSSNDGAYSVQATTSATDIAGNSAVASPVSVQIDTTPPVITTNVSPAPNAQGVYTSDVTVTFNCSDSGSGIASCPSPVGVKTDGTGQVVNGTATDIAGNSASASVTLNIQHTQTTGILVGSQTYTHNHSNLTVEGTTDWVHWGISNSELTTRKTGIQPVISDFAVVGSAAPTNYGNGENAYSWSDGAPTAQLIPSTTLAVGYNVPDYSGLEVQGTGNGFEITVPAKASTQTLRLYTGTFGGQLQVTAHLSDSSAPDYSDSSVTGQVTYAASATYRFDFRAVQPGSTLTVEVTLLNGFESIWAATSPCCYAAIESATLQPTAPLVALTAPLEDAIFAPTDPIQVAANGSQYDSPIASLSFLSDSANLGTLTNQPYTSTLSGLTAGPHTLTALATDINGAFNMSDPIHISVVNGGGTLSGSFSDPPAAADLSTGASDWVQFGLSDATSVNRKAGITSQIGTLQSFDGGPFIDDNTNFTFTAYSWSGGSPTDSVQSTQTGLVAIGVGNGYSFDVAADTTPKTLVVYTAAQFAHGRFKAELSDGSAAPFLDEYENVLGQNGRVYSLQFQAASPGQKLHVNYQLITNYGYGNLWLDAASLYVPNAPKISTISPSGGISGTVVTIDGSGFGDSSTGSISLNGMPMSVQIWSDSQIIVTVPQNATPGAIVVSQGEANSNGVDFSLLTIRAIVSPAPNQNGWNNTPVTVSFACQNATSCPASVSLNSEGTNQVISGTATDAEGASISTIAIVNIDLTSPQIWTNDPGNSGAGQVNLSGTLTDSLSGPSWVTCNGSAGQVSGDSFSCSASLALGLQTVAVVGFDAAGNTAANAVSVKVMPLRFTSTSFNYIHPDLANLAVGETIQLQLFNQDGEVTSGITWSVNDPNVATFSADSPSELVALAPGAITVKASTAAGNASATYQVLGALPFGTFHWAAYPAHTEADFLATIEATPTAAGNPSFYSAEADYSNPALVRAFDYSGKELWRTTLPGTDTHQSVSLVQHADGGTLAIASDWSDIDRNGGGSAVRRNIFKLAPDSGKIQWQYYGDAGLQNIAVHPNGDVYFIHRGWSASPEIPEDDLIALDGVTGSQKFSLPLPISTYNHIWQCSYLLGTNAYTDGTQPDESIYSQPFFAQDGDLYFVIAVENSQYSMTTYTASAGGLICGKDYQGSINNSLQLAQVSPTGSMALTTLDSFQYSGPVDTPDFFNLYELFIRNCNYLNSNGSCADVSPTSFTALTAVPDGKNGVLSEWFRSTPNPGSGWVNNDYGFLPDTYSLYANDAGASLNGGAPLNVLNNAVNTISAAWDVDTVLGSGNTVFQRVGDEFYQFDSATGAVNWKWQAPQNYPIKLHFLDGNNKIVAQVGSQLMELGNDQPQISSIFELLPSNSWFQLPVGFNAAAIGTLGSPWDGFEHYAANTSLITSTAGATAGAFGLASSVEEVEGQSILRIPDGSSHAPAAMPDKPSELRLIPYYSDCTSPDPQTFAGTPTLFDRYVNYKLIKLQSDGFAGDIAASPTPTVGLASDGKTPLQYFVTEHQSIKSLACPNGSSTDVGQFQDHLIGKPDTPLYPKQSFTISAKPPVGDLECGQPDTGSVLVVRHPSISSGQSYVEGQNNRWEDRAELGNYLGYGDFIDGIARFATANPNQQLRDVGEFDSTSDAYCSVIGTEIQSHAQ